MFGDITFAKMAIISLLMQYLYKIFKIIFVFFEPNAYIQHLLSLKAHFPNGFA